MTDFVISNDLVVLGGVDFSGGSGSGSILAANASGFAVLDETSSASNPTLIPRRADLTTGMGGSDGEGTPFLHLITGGVQRMIMSAASTTFFVTDRVQVNGRIMVFGNSNQTQLFVRGHSTQTGTIVLIENNAQDSLLEINDLGTITLGDELQAAIDVLHLSHPSNPGPSGTLIDSHAILMTGTSSDGSPHDIDWKAFVDVTANDGTGSLFTVQSRIDAAGFATLLTISDAGALRASGASGHAFGSPATNSVLTIDTTSTANGGGTSAAAVNFFPDYTGASGLTTAINLMRLAGNIQTQAVAEVIANVSTLAVDEPAISIGAGSSITNAQTFLIEDAPTEGASNFAMRVVSGLSQFGGDVQAATALGPAFLNETSSATNPTLIPNRGDLTTGIGAATGEGTTLHLVVAGGNRVVVSSAQMVVNTVSTVMNGRLDILGDGSTDQVPLLVRGFNGQTVDNLQVKAAIPTIVDVLTVDQSGVTTLGEGLPSPIDALILDSAALTGDGQRDSHAILLTGKGFETATPHDIDWKAFVNVTADDGTGSIWTLQSRIDAGGFTNRFTVDDTGNILTTGLRWQLGDGGGEGAIFFSGCTNFFAGITASPEEYRIGTGTDPTANAQTEFSMDINSIKFRNHASNGQFMDFKQAGAVSVALSGASVTLVNAIPAGVFVMAVTARVTTAITGPTGFDLGDGSTVDRWGNSIAVALGTTVDITDYVTDGFGQFPAGSDIVITSDGVNFTGGVLRVTVHYWIPNAPTS